MSGTNETLPQLYRFCYLMTGDEVLAEQSFQAVVRETARRSSRGGPADTKLWLFREARTRCLEAAKSGLQPEAVDLPEEELSASAAGQVAALSPAQFATWIAAAPDPQRSALALHYLDEFSHREIMDLLGLRLRELADLLARSRRQMQAWLTALTEQVVT